MIKTKNKCYLIFLLSALVCTVILSGIFLFTNIITATANGAPIEVMDGRFSYSPDTVYTVLNLLGESGRREYLTFHILDYFYLLSYGALMAACLKPFVSKKTKWAYIVFPALPAGFDFIENSLIRLASSVFPKELPALGNAISVFTTLKWSLGLLWFVVFLAFFGLWLRAKIKKPQK